MSKLVLLINEPRICAGCQFCESEYTGEGINKKYATYGFCDSYVEPNIEDEIIFYYENYNGSITGAFPMSELGKTVFLTREEAAKKLEEMKNDKA